MSDLVARLHVLGIVLARRMPVVLAATVTLLESVLEAAGIDTASERLPTAPVTLTAEQVLEAARTRGVSAFANGQMVLLASLGLDLKSANIRAALLEMHHRRELRLARLANSGAARVALDARGLRPELVDESIISDGESIFHAVELP